MPSWPESTQESSELRETELILRKFERCEFRAEDFHHRDHLAVMVCYLERMPLRQALAHIREALLRFTAHHNRKGYKRDHHPLLDRQSGTGASDTSRRAAPGRTNHAGM